MKYLVLLIVLGLVYLVWRGQRIDRGAPPAPPPPPLPAPQDIVACVHCGVHGPRSEALSQGALHYCCIEHQRADGR